MRALPPGAERDRLDAEQQALKIIANATCYGIFVELNVVEYARKREVTYYGGDEQPRTAKLASIEEPGRFFHPLLATLTTGGGAPDAGPGRVAGRAARASPGPSATPTPWPWPARRGWPRPSSWSAAERVRGWFEQLNPYRSGDELFKLEDANYALDGARRAGSRSSASPSPTSATCCSTSTPTGGPCCARPRPTASAICMAPYPDEKAPAAIPAPRVPLARARRRALAA